MKDKYLKCRELFKIVLIHLIETEKEIDKLIEYFNQNRTLLKFDVELEKDVLPLVRMTEILGIDNDDDECDEMCNKISYIVDNECDVNEKVEKFMKMYNL